MYLIVYRQYYVMGSMHYEVIRRVYRECEKAQWDMDTLREIHDRYQKYRKNDEGIYRQNGGYLLYVNDGQRRYAGRYRTITEARKMKRKILRGEVNDPVRHRKTKRRKTSRTHPDRYIKVGRTGKYEIRRQGEYYGVFPTIEEARRERDLLEANEWDYGNIVGLNDGYNDGDEEK